jgi:hypothetical protein
VHSLEARAARHASFALLTLLIAGCSYSGGTRLVPSTTSDNQTSKKIDVSFKVLVPRYVAHTTSRLRPQYVSSSTESISITVDADEPVDANLTPSSPGCTTVSAGTQCTIPVAAAPGSDTFAVTTYDSLNATGNKLSTASVTQTIVAGELNTVNVTLDGIVASIVLSLQSAPPPEGNPATIGVSVMARDADGNTIVGPGSYDNTISLADADASDTTKLSVTTVTAPSTSVTLSYNGGALSSAGLNAHVTASSSGVPSSEITDVYFVTAQDQWVTWGKTAYRNSYNPTETTLTSSNVSGLKLLWQTTLGGVITDEPIVVANVAGTSEGPVDVLYVGDAHANLYAINAGTGKVLWSKTLQTEAINGNSSDPAQQYCFDQPGGLYGIGGTPVADPASNTVYAVDGMGYLYGFDLATGNQKFKAGPVWPYDTSDNDLNITNDYGALNEDVRNGVVYIPGGAHCGNENYGGVARYTISSGSITNWYTMGGPPNVFGGVWGPGGPVIDPRDATNPSSDNVYFGTAFGQTPPGANQYPYSVVRLTESLSVNSASVNPVDATWPADLDFGDTPLVFAPAASSGCGTAMLAAAESKNGKLYLFNADNLDAGPTQTIQLGTLSQDGINLGTAAYDPTRNLFYVNNGSDSSAGSIDHGLIAFTLASNCQLQVAWQETVGPNKEIDGPPAPPTVANGVVYYADGPGSNCSPVGNSGCGAAPADFNAYNATSGALLFHTTVTGPLFTAPVVVNGRVYVTSWNGSGPGVVYCFGL